MCVRWEGGWGCLAQAPATNRNSRAEDFSPLGFALPRPAAHGFFPQHARSPSRFKPPQVSRTPNPPSLSLTLLPSPAKKSLQSWHLSSVRVDFAS